MLKSIGIDKIILNDQLNVQNDLNQFDKIEVKNINDISIAVFLNINNVEINKLDLTLFHDDLIRFLNSCFVKLKTENQFLCPNQKELNIIKIYQKDINCLSSDIVKMYRLLEFENVFFYLFLEIFWFYTEI